MPNDVWSTINVEEYRTTNLDREAVRVIQQVVSEQVLQEKNAFLEQELYQRRLLVRCMLGFVVVVICIMAAAAVAVIVLQKMNNTCVKWLQNKEIGKIVAFLHAMHLTYDVKAWKACHSVILWLQKLT